MIHRLVRDYPIQLAWTIACFTMGIVGSLACGALGQLIF